MPAPFTMSSPVNIPPSTAPDRPAFNSHITQDRLREGQRRHPSLATNIKKNRRSVFTEVGLGEDDSLGAAPSRMLVEEEKHRDGAASESELHGSADPGHSSTDKDNEVTNKSGAPTSSEPVSPTSMTSSSSSSKAPWYAKLATGRRTRARVGMGSGAPSAPFLGVSTMAMLALAVAVLAPTMLGSGAKEAGGSGMVDAGVVLGRADSPVDVCARWAQQSE